MGEKSQKELDLLLGVRTTSVGVTVGQLILICTALVKELKQAENRIEKLEQANN